MLDTGPPNGGYSINIGYECIFYHPNIVIRPFNHINLQHDYACAEKITIKYEKVETSRPQAIYGHQYPCPAFVYVC